MQQRFNIYIAIFIFAILGIAAAFIIIKMARVNSYSYYTNDGIATSTLLNSN